MPRIIADSLARDKFNLTEENVTQFEAQKLVSRVNSSRQGSARIVENGDVEVRSLLID